MNNNIQKNIKWLPHDLQNNSRWFRPLLYQEKLIIDEILTQISSEKAERKTTAMDLSFQKLSSLYKEIFEETINQYGFILLRGLPTTNNIISIDLIKKFFLYFSQKLGAPIIQNKKHEYIYDVKEIKTLSSDTNVRGPQLAGALPLHADHGGLLGMYCLNSAHIGGHTLLGNTHIIHDEIKKINPDLLNILYQPFYGDRRGQEPNGKLPYDVNPIFAIKNNQLICQYVGIYYRDAPNKFPHIPKLTKQQINALDLFHKVSNSNDIIFEIKLLPGDVIFINNNQVLHGRTPFQNIHGCALENRHLLRIWLSTPKIESFPHYYGYPMPYL